MTRKVITLPFILLFICMWSFLFTSNSVARTMESLVGKWQELGRYSGHDILEFFSDDTCILGEKGCHYKILSDGRIKMDLAYFGLSYLANRRGRFLIIHINQDDIYFMKIKQVENTSDFDFKNYFYTPSIAEDYGLDRDRIIVLQNNASRESTKNGDVSFSVEGVYHGDLTGDGEDEAIVLLACQLIGANYWDEEVFVYTFKGGVPYLVGSISNKDLKSRYSGILWRILDRGVRVEKGCLFIGCYADGPHCCPENIVTFSYKIGSGYNIIPVGEPKKRSFKN